MSASSTRAAHAGLISLRNEPYAHFLCWERRRALRVLRGVGNRVLMSPSSGVRENTIGGCVSRSTPIFFWCREPVWERGGGGRTVARLFAGTVDCCFEHV